MRTMLTSSTASIGVVLACLFSTSAFCQINSLALSSGTALPGGSASLTLKLTSPSGNRLAALQWTLVYSPTEIVAISARLGYAATAAGKALSCIATPGTYTCFITGLSANGPDANLIRNGVVAVVSVTISPGTTSASIGITNALGATRSAGAEQIVATGGTITAVMPLGLLLSEQIPSNSNVSVVFPNDPSLPVPASFNGASGASGLSWLGVRVSLLVCKSTTLGAGASAACTLTLSAPAPTGGVTVPIVSNSSALRVPAFVDVPAGWATIAFTATATATLAEDGTPEAAIITAILGGASRSEAFTLILCPCSLWRSTAQPVNPASTNEQAIEAGMRFSSHVSGFVTGVRFFKAPTNGGTHVGNLWDSGGMNLANVTFTDETPSGWQVAYFAWPVDILANTTYVISYYAPQGHNAADNGSFTTSVSNSPIEALANSQNGPNGVYRYGASAFPTIADSAANYWVDAILNTSATIGTAPPVSIWAPTAAPDTAAVPSAQSAELGLTFMSAVPGYITGVRFYKSSENLGIHVGNLWTASGILLASVTFTHESAVGWQQANFSSPIAIDANIPYVVSYCSPEGHYAADAGYFATSGVSNQMLYAPPNGQYGPNGSYGTSETVLTGSSGSSNYWVDVVFTIAIQ
jgi:hypothetical protein